MNSSLVALVEQVDSLLDAAADDAANGTVAVAVTGRVSCPTISYARFWSGWRRSSTGPKPSRDT